MTDQTIQSFAIVGNAIAMAAVAYFQYRNTVALGRVQKSTKKTEHNTNSMTEALVALTEKEALARGIREGLASGVQQERDRNAEEAL